MARIVAVTAAQNGVSTPFLAAESLRQAGEALGNLMTAYLVFRAVGP